MRRLFNALGLLALVILVLAGAFAGYLATSNTPPRRLSEGWVRVTNMPSARGEVASAVVESIPRGPKLCVGDPCPERLVYVVGGLGGALGRTSDVVSIFDPPAQAWRVGPPLPEPRHHLAATGLADTLYVTGGSVSTTSFAPERNVWVLRPGRRTFERLAAMPEGRTAHGMVDMDGKVYVVGGKGPTSRVMIFEPGGGWHFGAAMPGPRDHAAVVAFQSRIYVIGGRDQKGVSKRVDVYDPAADEWSEGPSLPQANSAMAVAVLADGLIHIAGGEDPRVVGGSVRDVHLVLDTVAKVWLVGPKPIQAVHGTPGVAIQGKLLIVGGARRQGLFSALGWTGIAQVFDPGLLLDEPTPNPTPQNSPTPRQSSPASKATATPT